jgi:nucleoside phosphorylase
MDNDAENLLLQAVDAIAVGYPLNEPPAEQDAWFGALRALIEERVPIARERLRKLMRE